MLCGWGSPGGGGGCAACLIPPVSAFWVGRSPGFSSLLAGYVNGIVKVFYSAE
jgi:hypothetical protein